jgi:hypothetical protein
VIVFMTFVILWDVIYISAAEFWYNWGMSDDTDTDTTSTAQGDDVRQVAEKRAEYAVGEIVQPQMILPPLPAGYTMDDVIVLSNGTLKDKRTGHFLTAPTMGNGANRITPATATQMAHTRWQRYRTAAVQGLAEAGRTAGRKGTSTDTWGWIVEHQATLAATNGSRTSTEAARFVGQAIEALPTTQNRHDGGGDTVVSLPEHTLLAIVDRLIAAKQGADDGDG